MLFYFDFGNYFKMLRLAWGERSFRARLYYLAVLLVGVPITSSFHALCFALDPILFPGLRQVEVRAPVFIVGHGRSGTTLTFRLIDRDEGRWSSFALWECYFPSLLQKKAIRAVAALDRRWFRGVLAGAVGRFEEWRYGPSRHMHRMGLTLPEEDDISLFYSMAAGFWMTKMPWMGEFDFFYVDRWPEEKRLRRMRFYRELVRRQLYLNGTEKTHLSKNPYWSGRVQTLIDVFPDARFIVNLRDPRETIPSLLKLNRSAWNRLGWDPARQKESLDVLIAQSEHNYRHPFEVLDASPQTPHAILEYKSLTQDPAAAITEVYEALGLPVTDAFRARLAAEGGRERQHRTRFTYSLEEFGLAPDIIRNMLGDLYERFGWDDDLDREDSTQEQLAQ